MLHHTKSLLSFTVVQQEGWQALPPRLKSLLGKLGTICAHAGEGVISAIGMRDAHSGDIVMFPRAFFRGLLMLLKTRSSVVGL